MKSAALRHTLALLLFAGVLLSGCAKKAVEQPPTPQTPPPVPTTPAPSPPTSSDPTPTTPAPDPSTSGSAVGDLQPVFFDYDSDALREDSRGVLDRNARMLRDNASMRLTVEGHCDERGTAEYNQSLGERRAQAARDYLVQAGIATARLRVLSYGKERPFATGSDEAAYAQNRRAHFSAQ
ncbi:MAG: peptidoglycan-associated lipoprotein Pal [Candidatus Eisenbacteria bacterium]